MDIMIIILLIISILLLGTGLPIFVSFSFIGAVIMLFYLDGSMASIAQMFYSNLDNSSLLSIPFFILAGNLMTTGGISRRLISLANSFVGHWPGGMTTTVVAVTTFFGAVSGSHVAVAVAVGGMMIPEMEKLGYKRSFSAALIANITCTAMLIPPSLAAIIYGYATSMSIGKLFMAGMIPGILMAVILGAVAMFTAWRRGYGAYTTKASWAERGRATFKAIPALMMPVIILGGIYSGVFTCTEAAAVSAVYALLVGLFVYREIKFYALPRTIIETAKTVANLFFLVTASLLIGKVLVSLQVPQNMTNLMLAGGIGKIGFCLLAIVILFVLGTFLEATPMMLCSLPIFWPSIQTLGVDPYMFYVLMVCMVGVAQISPPEGVALFVMSSVAGVPVMKLFYESIIYMVLIMVVAIVVVYFPWMASWLPSKM
jgi:C4-dicarboxylate transporter DctM subunit